MERAEQPPVPLVALRKVFPPLRQKDARASGAGTETIHLRTNAMKKTEFARSMVKRSAPAGCKPV